MHKDCWTMRDSNSDHLKGKGKEDLRLSEGGWKKHYGLGPMVPNASYGPVAYSVMLMSLFPAIRNVQMLLLKKSN